MIPWVYRLVVETTYLPVIFSGMHLEVHGREHMPPPGTPLVVAANHVSALDPFLVARALPPGRFLQFMAKKELFIPGIGDIIRAGVLPGGPQRERPGRRAHVAAHPEGERHGRDLPAGHARRA